MPESAINPSSEPNVDEKAKSFVTDLIACGPEKQSGLDAEYFATSTWQVLTYIASRIPSRHYGQDVLVRIVGRLDAAGEPWNDLRGFGISLRGS